MLYVSNQFIEWLNTAQYRVYKWDLLYKSSKTFLQELSIGKCVYYVLFLLQLMQLLKLNSGGGVGEGPKSHSMAFSLICCN